MNLKKLNRKSLAVSTTLFLVFGFGIYDYTYSQDQLGKKVQFGAPYTHVRFIGTFYAPDAMPENTGGLRNIQVHLEDGKEWVFVIEDAESLSAEKTMSGIVQDIFPRRLTFIGDAEELEPFKGSEIAGKHATIEGNLYKSVNRFYITEIEVSSAEKPEGSE